MEHSSGAIKTAFDIQVDGKRGPGRPKMTWKPLTERDCREWKLSAINPHDRRTWRSGVRSAMRAASQASYLEGGPPMWMLPLYLHVNQKSDYDYDMKYTSRSSLGSAIDQCLQQIPKEDYLSAFRDWVKRLQKCVLVKGEYFEGL